LQVSSYWSPGDVLTLGLLPEEELRRAVRPSNCAAVRSAMRSGRARSFSTTGTSRAGRRRVKMVSGDLRPSVSFASLTARLTQWQLTPAGTEGYRTAEVMVGGVDTAALSSKTMMAKTQPGLYFIGECVDVTGWLGGYNFQWAWSSGWVAGQAIKAGL
ncbi:NAD(P)/FAD-dependent oxidoreductase, partial [Planktomarina temperata]|nr:NAD(P)/FAD-dependent oxidoreductase [Planktomarina temperata]